jgi:hypothetical protein
MEHSRLIKILDIFKSHRALTTFLKHHKEIKVRIKLKNDHSARRLKSTKARRAHYSAMYSAEIYRYRAAP